jgi:hypothetical protein
MNFRLRSDVEVEFSPSVHSITFLAARETKPMYEKLFDFYLLNADGSLHPKV